MDFKVSINIVLWGSELDWTDSWQDSAGFCDNWDKSSDSVVEKNFLISWGRGNQRRGKYGKNDGAHVLWPALSKNYTDGKELKNLILS
jgi:hypothetical protein